MSYDPYWQCDYCHEQHESGYMRAVGFLQLEEDGPNNPLVKFWCGKCEPDDEIDSEAQAVLHTILPIRK